jgi:hypothetical protein
MNKVNFYSENIYSISQENELKKLIEVFPYFQLAYIKLLKNLNQNQSIYFEKFLRKSAAIVPSRKIVYQFLQQFEKTKEYQNILNSALEAQNKEDLNFEKEMLSWSMAGAYKLNDKPIQEENTNSKIEKTESKNIISPTIQNEEEKLKNKENAEIEIKPIEIIESKTEIKIQAPKKRDFKSWLNTAQEIKNTIVEKENSTVNLLEQKTAESPKNLLRKEVIEQNSIIEQFIGNETKISKKQSFFDPAKMAKKSVEENDEIISETLAKIYHSQGNKIKSIEIYEKLILKFPTKKDYFADLILKIKKEES